jgi:uracil-DNA glycosylase family 4
MTRREALDLIDDWLATGFRRSRPAEPVEPVAETLAAPAAAPAPAPTDRSAALAAIAAEVAACEKCDLCLGRTRTVPGEGSLDPPVLFVGEGPGEEEDRTGRPFVGAAGQYLDKWIAAIGLDRGRCFIANCVKCRPPQNREPRPEEIGACLPYLERQVALLAPRAICCLGRIASHVLLATERPLGQLRGKVYRRGTIPVVVTYHPSAVLRDQSLRAAVWQDLKMLKALLDHG